jgi:dolichyl-phosphate beta-glucosyltransferase
MITMEISIIIPAYNEEKRIQKTLERIFSYMKEKKHDFEIIVVDDGSKDKTVELVELFRKKNSKGKKKADKNRIKILKNIKNKGKGHSVKRGMLSGEKKWLLFSDADLSTPIEEIEKFEKYIDQYLIIIASRNLKESQIKIKQPKIRSTLGKIFPFVVNLFTIRGIKDTQCGFKLFRKDVAEKIFPLQTSKRFAFDVEVLFIAKKHGYKIKEIPVIWINALGSKVDPIKDSISMFFDLIRFRFNSIMGRYNKQ